VGPVCALAALDRDGLAHRSAATLIGAASALCLLAAGLIAWWQRPTNRLGLLMVLAGVLWQARNLQLVAAPVPHALGYVLTYLPALTIAHLALAYPTGRLTRPVERYTVTGSYVVYLVLQSLRYRYEGGGAPIGWPRATPNSPWANIVAGFGLLFTIVVLALLARRWRRASPTTRRMHAPVWLGQAAIAGTFVTGVTATALRWPASVQIALVCGYGLGLIWLPLALLTVVMSNRLARRRVADLVVALPDHPEPGRLRELLATTLADPGLELAYWSESDHGYRTGCAGRWCCGTPRGGSPGSRPGSCTAWTAPRCRRTSSGRSRGRQLSR